MPQTLITTPFPTPDEVARLMGISPERARVLEQMVFGTSTRESRTHTAGKPVARKRPVAGVARRTSKPAHQ